MSLRDKFRIDELVKKGSKAVEKDSSKGIIVRRLDGKEIKPSTKKTEKPFGQEPIRGKQSNPKIKTDLLEPDTITNEEQTSFSGETVSNIERPYYDEEQLKKAVDIAIDELIGEKQEIQGKFVRLEKYDTLKKTNRDLSKDLRDVSKERDDALGLVNDLQTQIEDLTNQLIAKTSEVIQRDEQFKELQARYEVLLDDFQSAILKGTREGIERVSLTAQVTGLGAQKETLASQLTTQKDIVENLTENIKTLNGVITANQKVAEEQIRAANQRTIQAQNTATAAANSKKKKIICNELYHQGYLSKEIWIADENFGDWLWENHRTTAIGYTIWARKVVNFMQRKPQYTKYIYKFLKPWTQQMAYQMGVVDKTHPFGWLTMKIGWQFSNLVYTMYGNEFEKLLSRVNKIG
jgi:chromosome segregation ATPase